MNIEQSFDKLKAYCEKEQFKGWDPFDGLTSKLFNSIPFVSKNRLARLAWIQLFKRNPVNLRKAAGIAKDYNPKGVGLFLNGYCNLYKIEPKDEYLERINELSEKVIELSTKGFSGYCWGYNFDWQSRAFFQPKFTPTIVATTFISNALMDAYEITKNIKYLEVALSSKEFILNDLNRTFDDKGNFAFSYSPEDKTQVFNATLLGSRLLARIYSYNNDQALIEAAKKSVEFCCNYQQENGAWSYGTLPFHQWIDNFHTGYNLECIDAYQKHTNDFSYQKHLDKGLKYYLENFFTEEGMPKYYNNQTYPIDIHTTSQLILTLSKLDIFQEHKPLIDKVLNWTINNMQDESGYFYYQLKKNVNSKIPYMRWAQAWMFLGMSEYLLKSKTD